MAYELTVAGYKFQNPPEEYRKLARVGNNAQPAVGKEATDFYQSDSQDLQFQCEGTLALDPPLGEDTDDLAELERLQEIAIQGGEVEVVFTPFFEGTCVIEDDPFRQSEGESSYQFTFSVNEDRTLGSGGWPTRNPPDTGNTFELGSINIGYDPDSVQQNYERQTESVKPLRGVAQSVDNAGLVPKVQVSGNIDGEGQEELWQKARGNVLAYLSAEFQKGWCLIDSLSIRNNPDAPDYLDGLFQYDLDVLIVKDPESGIGSVSSYVDQKVKRTGTYAGDSDSGNSSFTDLEFTVEGGTGSLDGDYLEWDKTTLTLSDNDTNYVYVDDADGDGYGTVKANQSAFPADGLELYRVETANGEITKVVDIRAILIEDQDSEEGGDDGGETIGGDVYFTVFGGDYEIVNGTTSTWADTRLLLASSDRNYIWVEDDNTDGQAEVNTSTSGYPSSGNFIQMYRVDTDADSVTNIIDDRPADINDSGTDTGDADLNLTETLSVRDQFNFERLLTLDDVLAVQDPSPLPALGLLDLADTLPLNVAKRYVGRTTLQKDVAVLDDGGTAVVATGGPSITTEFHFWNQARDWEDLVENTGWEYGGTDTITASDLIQDFEEGNLNDWNNLAGNTVADNSRAFNGTYSLYSGDYSNGGCPSPFGTWQPPGYSGGGQPNELEFYYNETSNSTGAGLRVFNSNGNPEFGMATDNPEWYIGDGNSNSDSARSVFDPGSDEYDKWIRVRFYNIDWVNSTFDIEIEDTTGSYSTYTETGIPMRNGVDIERIELWGYNSNSSPQWGDDKVEQWFDDILISAEGGVSFTTMSKSFSEPTQPDFANLDYTLNGSDVDLTAIGSPGTVDEETQTVSLDGSSGFVLPWGSEHDDFRVKATFVAKGTDFPSISRLELSGETGGSGGPVSTLWDTDLDWEYYSSINNIGWGNSEIFLGLLIDDFDSYSTGSTPPDVWTVSQSNGVVSNTRSYSGTNSWEFTGNITTSGKEVLAYTEEPQARQFAEFGFTYWETTNNQGNGMALLDDQGREIIAFGTGNPAANVYNGSTTQLADSSDIDPDYQEWREFRVTIDWQNKLVDVVWEDLTGNSGTFEATGIPFNNSNASNVDRVEITADDRFLGTSGDMDVWYDDVWGKAADSGSITTGWNWFSEPSVPDFLELVNCQYSLNGETATVYVESDNNGDGTVDETSDAISLDGTQQFDVTGITTDSDRFRLRIELSTASVNIPIIDSITLQGNAGSSDSDQNESTTWNLRGGRYDTSGNEYEGGGMQVSYEF